jgi:hypothetical protein
MFIVILECRKARWSRFQCTRKLSNDRMGQDGQINYLELVGASEGALKEGRNCFGRPLLSAAFAVVRTFTSFKDS